jgi:hypothetical protein
MQWSTLRASRRPLTTWPWGFKIAARDIAPAIQRAEDQYGPTTLLSAFVMLGDILSAFGVTEAQLVELARQSARIQLSASPVLH